MKKVLGQFVQVPNHKMVSGKICHLLNLRKKGEMNYEKVQ